MISIAFPNMLSSAKVNLIKDHEATMSNMRLLLASWKTSLFGDPYFGTNLKRFIHDQNNIVIRDLVIDEIYLSLVTFMPQISIMRKDITITQKNDVLYAQINCINKLDSTIDLYEISLIEE